MSRADVHVTYMPPECQLDYTTMRKAVHKRVGLSLEEHRWPFQSMPLEKGERTFTYAQWLLSCKNWLQLVKSVYLYSTITNRHCRKAALKKNAAFQKILNIWNNSACYFLLDPQKGQKKRCTFVKSCQKFCKISPCFSLRFLQHSTWMLMPLLND